MGSGSCGISANGDNRLGTRAGTTFYLLKMEDGTLLDSRDVGNDTVAETIDNCAVANDANSMKNALQADPVATGPPNTRYITKVYIGDFDGRAWRFNLGLGTTDTPSSSGRPSGCSTPRTRTRSSRRWPR